MHSFVNSVDNSTYSLFVSVLALCLTVWTILSTRKQKRIDNLVSLQQFLHQADLSEARRLIREEKTEITLENTPVRRVCSTFDFAGTLVRNSAVDKTLFMQYWSVPLRCLRQPLENISEEITGDNVRVKDYYRDFWWLLHEAEETSLTGMRK